MLVKHWVCTILLTTLAFSLNPGMNAAAAPTAAIAERYATVNGVKLHYLVAGKGSPVILLHGYAQNSHMWRPLMKELAKTHLVVAPDLRGFGDSARPHPATTRRRWRRTSTRWPVARHHKAGVAGHDIG